MNRILIHNGHVLRPARYSDFVYQECDLCGQMWMTVDDCASEDLKCFGEPRKLPIIGRVDRPYGWRKLVGAAFFVVAASMLYGMVGDNHFNFDNPGLLVAQVLFVVISLALALLFWPDQ